MSPHERIATVLRGDAPDRPAFALWRHFPDDEASPEALARATVEFARAWRPDLLKQTPSGMFAVEDWARQLSGGGPLAPNPDEVPYTLNLAVDWTALARLDARKGALGREIESLRLVLKEIGGEVPVYMTVFGPLTLAAKLAGRRVVDNMRDAPSDLRAGLDMITQTMVEFVQAVREAGAHGLYFATQFASRDLIDEALHDEFGAPFDMALLEAWQSAGPVILHLCGSNVFFELANRYPVEAVCWDHGLSAPSFEDAFAATDRVLVAGMEERVFPSSPQAVGDQARAALAASRGRRHILAPTCVIPDGSPEGSFVAVRDAVDGFAPRFTQP